MTNKDAKKGYIFYPLLKRLNKVLSLLIVGIFLLEQAVFAAPIQPAEFGPLVQNAFISKFNYPVFKFLSVNPLNPHNYFNFLLDKGDGKLASFSLNKEAKQLLNYFYTGLNLPAGDFWVNLNPNQPDKIIPDSLSKTDLGRVMLEADLLLKQTAARITHPKHPVGKLYWDKLYQKIGRSKDVNLNNRLWIVPDKAEVWQTKDGVMIVNSSLKVMVESEYLKKEPNDPIQKYSDELIKELIIPEVVKALNTSKAFAQLRGVYNSLILAFWYKKNYSNLPTPNSQLLTHNWSSQDIFQQYLKSFKEGDYKWDEYVGDTQEAYVSGGVRLVDIPITAGSPAVSQLQNLATAIGGKEVVEASKEYQRPAVVVVSPVAPTNPAAARPSESEKGVPNASSSPLGREGSPAGKVTSPQSQVTSGMAASPAVEIDLERVPKERRDFVSAIINKGDFIASSLKNVFPDIALQPMRKISAQLKSGRAGKTIIEIRFIPYNGEEKSLLVITKDNSVGKAEDVANIYKTVIARDPEHTVTHRWGAETEINGEHVFSVDLYPGVDLDEVISVLGELKGLYIGTDIKILNRLLDKLSVFGLLSNQDKEIILAARKVKNKQAWADFGKNLQGIACRLNEEGIKAKVRFWHKTGYIQGDYLRSNIVFHVDPSSGEWQFKAIDYELMQESNDPVLVMHIFEFFDDDSGSISNGLVTDQFSNTGFFEAVVGVFGNEETGIEFLKEAKRRFDAVFDTSRFSTRVGKFLEMKEKQPGGKTSSPIKAEKPPAASPVEKRDEILGDEFDSIMKEEIKKQNEWNNTVPGGLSVEEIENMQIESMSLVADEKVGGKEYKVYRFEAVSKNPSLGSNFVIFTDKAENVLGLAKEYFDKSGVDHLDQKDRMLGEKYKMLPKISYPQFEKRFKSILEQSRAGKAQIKDVTSNYVIFLPLLNLFYGVDMIKADFIDNILVRNLLRSLPPELIFAFSRELVLSVDPVKNGGAAATSIGGQTWYHLHQNVTIDFARLEHTEIVVHELSHELFRTLDESAKEKLREHFLKNEDLKALFNFHPTYGRHKDDDLLTEMIAHTMSSIALGEVKVRVSGSRIEQGVPITKADIDILSAYGFLPSEFNTVFTQGENSDSILSLENLAGIYLPAKRNKEREIVFAKQREAQLRRAAERRGASSPAKAESAPAAASPVGQKQKTTVERNIDISNKDAKKKLNVTIICDDEILNAKVAKGVYSINVTIEDGATLRHLLGRLGGIKGYAFSLFEQFSYGDFLKSDLPIKITVNAKERKMGMRLQEGLYIHFSAAASPARAENPAAASPAKEESAGSPAGEIASSSAVSLPSTFRDIEDAIEQQSPKLIVRSGAQPILEQVKIEGTTLAKVFIAPASDLGVEQKVVESAYLRAISQHQKLNIEINKIERQADVPDLGGLKQLYDNERALWHIYAKWLGKALKKNETEVYNDIYKTNAVVSMPGLRDEMTALPGLKEFIESISTISSAYPKFNSKFALEILSRAPNNPEEIIQFAQALNRVGDKKSWEMREWETGYYRHYLLILREIYKKLLLEPSRYKQEISLVGQALGRPNYIIARDIAYYEDTEKSISQRDSYIDRNIGFLIIKLPKGIISIFSLPSYLKNIQEDLLKLEKQGIQFAANTKLFTNHGAPTLDYDPEIILPVELKDEVRGIVQKRLDEENEKHKDEIERNLFFPLRMQLYEHDRFAEVYYRYLNRFLRSKYVVSDALALRYPRERAEEIISLLSVNAFFDAERHISITDNEELLGGEGWLISAQGSIPHIYIHPRYFVFLRATTQKQGAGSPTAQDKSSSAASSSLAPEVDIRGLGTRGPDVRDGAASPAKTVGSVVKTPNRDEILAIFEREHKDIFLYDPEEWTLLKQAEETLALKPGQRYLHVGESLNKLVLLYALFGIDSVYVDKDPQLISLLKDKINFTSEALKLQAKGKVEYVEQDVSSVLDANTGKLAGQENLFYAVTMFNVFFDFEGSIDKAIENILKLVKDGGTIWFTPKTEMMSTKFNVENLFLNKAKSLGISLETVNKNIEGQYYDLSNNFGYRVKKPQVGKAAPDATSPAGSSPAKVEKPAAASPVNTIDLSPETPDKNKVQYTILVMDEKATFTDEMFIKAKKAGEEKPNPFIVVSIAEGTSISLLIGKLRANQIIRDGEGIPYVIRVNGREKNSVATLDKGGVISIEPKDQMQQQQLTLSLGQKPQNVAASPASQARRSLDDFQSTSKIVPLTDSWSQRDYYQLIALKILNQLMNRLHIPVIKDYERLNDKSAVELSDLRSIAKYVSKGGWSADDHSLKDVFYFAMATGALGISMMAFFILGSHIGYLLAALAMCIPVSILFIATSIITWLISQYLFRPDYESRPSPGQALWKGGVKALFRDYIYRYMKNDIIYLLYGKTGTMVTTRYSEQQDKDHKILGTIHISKYRSKVDILYNMTHELLHALEAEIDIFKGNPNADNEDVAVAASWLAIIDTAIRQANGEINRKDIEDFFRKLIDYRFSAVARWQFSQLLHFANLIEKGDVSTANQGLGRFIDPQNQLDNGFIKETVEREYIKPGYSLGMQEGAIAYGWYLRAKRESLSNEEALDVAWRYILTLLIMRSWNKLEELKDSKNEVVNSIANVLLRLGYDAQNVPEALINELKARAAASPAEDVSRRDALRRIAGGVLGGVAAAKNAAAKTKISPQVQEEPITPEQNVLNFLDKVSDNTLWTYYQAAEKLEHISNNMIPRDIFYALLLTQEGAETDYSYVLGGKLISDAGATGPLQIMKENAEQINDYIATWQEKGIPEADKLKQRILMEFGFSGNIDSERLEKDADYARKFGIVLLAWNYIHYAFSSLITTDNGRVLDPLVEGQPHYYNYLEAIFAAYNSNPKRVDALLTRHGPIDWLKYAREETQDYIVRIRNYLSIILDNPKVQDKLNRRFALLNRHVPAVQTPKSTVTVATAMPKPAQAVTQSQPQISYKEQRRKVIIEGIRDFGEAVLGLSGFVGLLVAVKIVYDKMYPEAQEETQNKPGSLRDQKIDKRPNRGGGNSAASPAKAEKPVAVTAAKVAQASSPLDDQDEPPTSVSEIPAMTFRLDELIGDSLKVSNTDRLAHFDFFDAAIVESALKGRFAGDAVKSVEWITDIDRARLFKVDAWALRFISNQSSQEALRAWAKEFVETEKAKRDPQLRGKLNTNNPIDFLRSMGKTEEADKLEGFLRGDDPDYLDQGMWDYIKEKVIDNFIVNGRLFTALPYIDIQETKAQKLTPGLILSKNLLPEIRQLIEDMHRAGIIHRDLKPDNIIFDPEEGIKIIDFEGSAIYQGDELLTAITSHITLNFTDGWAEIPGPFPIDILPDPKDMKQHLMDRDWAAFREIENRVKKADKVAVASHAAQETKPAASPVSNLVTEEPKIGNQIGLAKAGRLAEEDLLKANEICRRDDLTIEQLWQARDYYKKAFEFYGGPKGVDSIFIERYKEVIIKTGWKFREGISGVTWLWRFRSLYPELINFLRQMKPRDSYKPLKFVDMGFGYKAEATFETEEALRASGLNVAVYGVDMNPKFVESAREELRQRLNADKDIKIRFMQGDFNLARPELGLSGIDMIFVANVFLYYDEIEREVAIDTMTKSLGENGKIVLVDDVRYGDNILHFEVYANGKFLTEGDLQRPSVFSSTTEDGKQPKGGASSAVEQKGAASPVTAKPKLTDNELSKMSLIKYAQYLAQYEREHTNVPELIEMLKGKPGLINPDEARLRRLAFMIKRVIEKKENERRGENIILIQPRQDPSTGQIRIKVDGVIGGKVFFNIFVLPTNKGLAEAKDELWDIWGRYKKRYPGVKIVVKDLAVSSPVKELEEIAILLVDNSPSRTRLHRGALRDRGAIVITARDGNEALSILHAIANGSREDVKSIDNLVIISDVHLKNPISNEGLDGDELVGEIAKDELLKPLLPRIILQSSENIDLPEGVEVLPKDDLDALVLYKEGQPYTILDLIGKMVKSQGGAGSPAASGEGLVASLPSLDKTSSPLKPGVGSQELGGIDLSKVSLNVEDCTKVFSQNPVDDKILRAAEMLKRNWNAVAVLYLQEAMLLLKYNIVKDFSQRSLAIQLLSMLKSNEQLDENSLEFLNILQAGRPIEELKLALADN